MELQHQQGNTEKNGTAQTATTKAHQNGTAKNDNGALPKKDTATSSPKAETGPAKPTGQGTVAETVAPAPALEPIAEQPALAKEEPKAPKPTLNLEGTLKVIDDLHRRSIQRVNLISRIKQLETFEVNLTKENDELEENPYQGCKLIIQDDKLRQFVTTTPGLIRLVSQYIFNACHEKLAEIEAHIVLPH
jgi:hypothetical protein